MKILGMLILGYVGLIAVVGAAVANPAGAADSQVMELSMPSALLDRELDLSVYLPPVPWDGVNRIGDDARSIHEGLPLLLLFHGHGGNHRDWLRAGKVQATADHLIESGAIEPLIIVMPDAGNSWYIDNPDPDGAGPIASTLVDELPDYLAREFGADTAADRMAVAGLSMGGYGALRFAFEEPARFAAVVAMSPAIFAPESSIEDFSPLQLKLFNIAFGDPLDPDRFAAASPFSMVETLRQSPVRPEILLMSGDDDFFGLDLETMRLHLALEYVGVETEIRITDGGHVWSLWADYLEEALVFIDRTFHGIE